ncbi:MAG: TIGR01906 family membrane protein [Defluviitaleaceae bacterium]|nr:TIGR01906 family membrane protein [Defluviitaleaceae bacterium]
MRKRSYLRSVIAGLIAAANCVFVILLCLYAAIHLPSFNTGFYSWQYSVNDTVAVVGVEHDELMRVTRHMLDYMRGRTPYLQIYTEVRGELRPFFSEREILHMVDVYNLFVLGDTIRNIAAAWFLATIALLCFMRVPIILTLSKVYRRVIGLLAAGLAVLTILIARDFNSAWIVFHEIFFNNDLWLLDPNVDLLVNIVPLQFFLTLSVFVGVIFAALLAVVFAAAQLAYTRERRNGS